MGNIYKDPDGGGGDERLHKMYNLLPSHAPPNRLRNCLMRIPLTEVTVTDSSKLYLSNFL